MLKHTICTDGCRACPLCHAAISQHVRRCPHCTANLTLSAADHRPRPTIHIILGIFIIIVALAQWFITNR